MAPAATRHPGGFSLSHASRRAAVTAARAAYERWVGSAHLDAHARRTARRNAAFFLPFLRPGMSVLDAGCGPGSITLGLAEAVAPGPVTGVDISSASLERARALAAARGTANVVFEQHHLRALPYAHGTFDAVFGHAVMQHLDDPEAVLAELYRVLKPGGVIGLGDADFDGAIYWPEGELLERSMDVVAGLRAGAGDARVGKRLRGLLAGAGFVQVSAGVRAGADGDARSVAATGAYWANYLEQEPLTAYAEALGLATRSELVEMSAAWRRWSTHPGAFWGRFWCEAVGFKPPAPEAASPGPPA